MSKSGYLRISENLERNALSKLSKAGQISWEKYKTLESSETHLSSLLVVKIRIPEKYSSTIVRLVSIDSLSCT
jgi:hypothetical protein